MSRIRWYHFYFLLALFDVVVIMMSLELHHQTLDGVRQLIDSATVLDERSSWLQLVQQRILELNAPGNDLFQSENPETEYKRFKLARTRMGMALASPYSRGLKIDGLRSNVAEMMASAEEVFGCFRRMKQLEAGSEERRALLGSAGRAMARMDAKQKESLRFLGLLSAPNVGARNELLRQHENNLQNRLQDERYFIAAIVLILVGILFFGRRLQMADRALEVERQRVQAERKERLAAIGELCSSVAHGIRNPLAAMRSSAELTLELGKIDVGSKERVEDILAEGRRLGDRVTQLLNFARVNVEGFSQVELQSLVRTAIRELGPELHRRGISVRTRFRDAEILVNADRHQLNQIVIELVSNAMEQSKRGDEIVVACDVSNGDGMARLAVSDRGSGVPAEIRERIFDLFFTTKPTGTGIGLASVRRMARLHGGDVELTSDESGGARFVVSLPLIRKPGRFQWRGASAAC